MIAGILGLVAMASGSQQAEDRDVRPPPPPPLFIPEHHRNPHERIVTTDYSCADGNRSIRVEYEQFPKGSITALVRNGQSAPQEIIDKVNGFMAHFDYLTAIFPQCGIRDDVFSAMGISKGNRADILVRWTSGSANLDAAWSSAQSNHPLQNGSRGSRSARRNVCFRPFADIGETCKKHCGGAVCL